MGFAAQVANLEIFHGLNAVILFWYSYFNQQASLIKCISFYFSEKDMAAEPRPIYNAGLIIHNLPSFIHALY